jgi:integrase
MPARHPPVSGHDEGRLMILPDECWAAVEPFLEGKQPDDFLIARRDGESMGGYSKGWKSLVERAGLTGLHYHDLRRTAARNMIRAGVPERVVMEICGWRTRSMLDRYNIVDETDLANAARGMQKKPFNSYTNGYTGQISRILGNSKSK